VRKRLGTVVQKGNMNQCFGQFCAGAMLASVPVVLRYLGFQKQLVGGLTHGSVK
jgi:arabinogalactan oligomer/maltooligosaccharide transport system permease protein